jgi:hypothetical protein
VRELGGGVRVQPERAVRERQRHEDAADPGEALDRAAAAGVEDVDEVAVRGDADRELAERRQHLAADQPVAVDRLGGLSLRPTTTVLPGAVPFAVAFDAGGKLALAEAGPNAVATFGIDRRGTLQPIAQAATGQAATCWIVNVGGRLYLSNAGSATISAFDGALRPVGVTSTGAGTVDAAGSSDGRFLYVQTGAAGGVDAFRVGPDGSLTPAGSVVVPGAAGGEGIAAS